MNSSKDVKGVEDAKSVESRREREYVGSLGNQRETAQSRGKQRKAVSALKVVKVVKVVKVASGTEDVKAVTKLRNAVKRSEKP